MKLVVALLLGLVSADQPVHCVMESSKGVWEFNVLQDDNTIDLFKTNEVCSHQLPNKIQVLSPKAKLSFGQSAKTETYRVTFGDDYKASA